MQTNSEINVFDFDETLVCVNSFTEICKGMLLVFIRNIYLEKIGALVLLYARRRLRGLGHLEFKEQMMHYFEEYLSESEQKSLVQNLFNKRANENIVTALFKSNEAIVCTAAPYNYMSKLDFGRNVRVIASLCPHEYIVDRSNHGQGKVDNLKALLGSVGLDIHNYYTDDLVADAAVVKYARRTHLVKKGKIINTIKKIQ